MPSTDSLPDKLLDLGYELIMSTKNAWYFDHGFWGVTKYYTWKMAYDNRIPTRNGVLGGEACVWTELIDENNLGMTKNLILCQFSPFPSLMCREKASNGSFHFSNSADSRVWPRAAAVAERLWSNPDTPATKASERLYRHNLRLELLGIQPEPLTPRYCVLNEGQCT